jgi:hypothetical protein
MKNAGQAPPILNGGTRANNTFQKRQAKCIKPSLNETFSKIISSSLTYGPSNIALINYYL